jgi:hypothetical protein
LNIPAISIRATFKSGLSAMAMAFKISNYHPYPRNAPKKFNKNQPMRFKKINFFGGGKGVEATGEDGDAGV